MPQARMRALLFRFHCMWPAEWPAMWTDAASMVLVLHLQLNSS